MQPSLPESLVQALDAKAKVDLHLMDLWHRILIGEEPYTEDLLREGIDRCDQALRAVNASMSKGTDSQSAQGFRS
ncbi:MAG: hypothetical protein ABI905_09650 [Betaproteobacteria bacterium]